MLLPSLQSGDRLLRRTSFKLALKLEGPDLDQVVTLAFTMRRDRFMPVRREALRTAARLSLPGLVEELHAGLLDSHVSMREESRYYIQKIQPIDMATYYREQLSTAGEHNLHAAISGLGETGRRDDAGLIVSYTSHRMGQVRRAAIRAIAMLDAESHLEIFVKAAASHGATFLRSGKKIE